MGFLNLGSFAIQFANLIIILYILHRFLFKPYLAYLDAEADRRKKLEDELADLAGLRDRATTEITEMRRIATDEAKNIRTHAELMAKKEADTLLQRAKEEALTIKKRAEDEQNQNRLALERELQGRVLEIALSLNEKLFAKSLANREFLEEAGKKVTF